MFSLASQRADRLGVVLDSPMLRVIFGGVARLCANIFLKSRTPAMTGGGGGGVKVEKQTRGYYCTAVEELNHSAAKAEL